MKISNNAILAWLHNKSNEQFQSMQIKCLHGAVAKWQPRKSLEESDHMVLLNHYYICKSTYIYNVL